MFVFDNTYSWLHSKEVEFVMEVIGPHDAQMDPVNKQLENLTLREEVDDNKNVREKLEHVNETDLDIRR